MIGVDVLADQRDFAHAGIHEPRHFVDDFLHRSRDFRATRIGHDTERAEFVTAFLHGDEGRYAARTRCRGARRGEMIEFVVERKLGVDRLAVARCARKQIGQTVIVLRADHEIDGRCAPDDFLAFGLRDAAGHGDANIAALGLGRLFQAAHAAELGIDLFRRLLADVAGVEDDEVGIVGAAGLDIALGRECVRHTL